MVKLFEYQTKLWFSFHFNEGVAAGDRGGKIAWICGHAPFWQRARGIAHVMGGSGRVEEGLLMGVLF
jgi:hypothetical protein